MTKYKEILRLKSLGLSQQKIADGEIEKLLFPDKQNSKKGSERKMPDFEQIRTELELLSIVVD